MIFEALQKIKKSLYYSQDKNVECLLPPRGQFWESIWDKSATLMQTSGGNSLGTSWKLHENLMGTHWEHKNQYTWGLLGA